MIAGRKELIKMKDVCSVYVPRYKEFRADKLYKLAIASEKL